MIGKILTALTVFAAACAHSASVDDVCIAFSTKGPDCYADGTRVLDGECYALVWTRDGVFEGFSADGECTDANDRIVLVAPVAKDGRCPEILFQVSKEDAESLDGGKYAVYLLDTRVASGSVVKPRGTANGKIELMNGYGAVTATLAFDKEANLNVATENESLDGGQVASGVSKAPDCRQPKIKNVDIKGDKVYLTVENLPGFMRVQGGKDVKTFDTTGFAMATDGESGEVILVAPKKGASGFYKVIRN